MNKIFNAVDRAGAEFINGINASNPEHQPLHSISQFKNTKPREREADESLGLLLAGTGLAVTIGSVAFEAVASGAHEATETLVSMGLGAAAVGALVTIASRISNH